MRIRTTGRRALLALTIATAVAGVPGAATADPSTGPIGAAVSVPSPEAEINVTGAPFTGTDAKGRVRGFVDAHSHLFANEGFGGDVLCGKVFDPAGVAAALQDCPDHYPDGSLAWFDNLTRTGSPIGTHDPVGWPTFTDWPSHDSLTHQQMYYRWVERAWRGGERVMVLNLVTNGVLCSIYPIKTTSCDEMDAIRREAADAVALEKYVDAQYGGTGQGWFRIVKTPQEAQAAIVDGKLAVVLGIETSEPFGCKEILGFPQCTKSDIDKGLDEVYALGVRSMFPCHKFDNALCGVRFDSGTIGAILNEGQLISTGHWWQTEPCRTTAHDNTIEPAVLPAEVAQYFPGGLVAPVYGPGPHCNRRGLTSLGTYLVQGMMKRKMMIEVDHMSAKAANSTLSLIESAAYPGVLSTHSWLDPTYVERVYRAGGFVTGYPTDAASFITSWQQTKALRDKYSRPGYGFGLDMNGFGGWPAPVGPEAPNAVTYPFRTFDGGSVVDRQQAGKRSFDVNTDGLAEYGLLPDYIEQIRRTPGGQAVVDDLAQGAASYLQTWTATAAYAP
jgi:microsomal dipeptidase-like Zn-dependent dipeptidase